MDPAVSEAEAALKRVEDLERGDLLPSQEFGQPFQEVRSLVWAKNNPVYRVALDEWERKERLFSGRVERREKSSADLINQIFNLVGFFSGFQGLVLTAVSQLAVSQCKSQCRKVWFPILLTVAAAIVAIIGIWQKFAVLRDLEKSIKTEKQAHTEATKRGDKVRTAGRDFRFHNLNNVLPKAPASKSYSRWKWESESEMTKKTKVINKTGSVIILTMATGGIQFMVSQVEDDGHYSIKIDPNATYREYWCAVQPDNKDKMILSSDDCVEFSEVELVVNNSKYEWVGTRFRDPKRTPPAAGQAGSSLNQASGPANGSGAQNVSHSAKSRSSERCIIS